MFHVWPCRVSLLAKEPVRFPQGKAANVLRGAFGMMLARGSEYERVFAPKSAGAGPSGFADLPRPFVFRASHLDGRTIGAGEAFHFDVNLFEPHLVDTFREAFARGQFRGAVLQQVELLGAVGIELAARDNASHATVQFLSPTELKHAGGLAERPDFAVLFARARDRVSALRSLYGDGPLELDFQEAGERATHIRMTRCDVAQVDIVRLSTRTQQVHPLGGFMGAADYEGDLGEFLPVLRAAGWTGVGRQTVWGKGQIKVLTRTEPLPNPAGPWQPT